mgnify:FL=1
MKSYTETICDANGFEILVGYDSDYAEQKGYNEEPGNAATFVEPMVYTELKSVELIVAGRGIELLPMLHPNEKEFIISKLNYDAS